MRFSKILVAVDGSEVAARAVGVAAELAASVGADLALVSVADIRGAVPLG